MPETETPVAKETPLQQTGSRRWIYDMDAHIIDTDEDIRPFLEKSYRDRAGSLLATDEWHRGVIRRPRAPQDLAERLRILDDEAVICSVLFPTRAMDVNTMRDKAFVAAYCRAYNTFIADVCRQTSALKGMAVLPFDNGSAAAEELTRAVTKLGLVGVVMSSYGLQDHIGSTKYWPIYEAMEHFNVHLGIHNSIQGGPIGDLRADTFMFQHTVGRPARDDDRLRGADLWGRGREVSQIAGLVPRSKSGLGAVLDGVYGQEMGEAPFRRAPAESQTERLYARRQLLLFGGAR